MLVFVGKMLTNAYIFNLIERSRAFVVIIGLFGLPKRKILVLRFAIVFLYIRYALPLTNGNLTNLGSRVRHMLIARLSRVFRFFLLF